MHNALKLCLIAVIAAPAIVAALSARPPPPPKRGKSKGGKHKRRNKAVEAPSASASIEDREARLRARFASWSGGDDDDDDDDALGAAARRRRAPAEAAKPRRLGPRGAAGLRRRLPHPPPARRRRGAGGARRGRARARRGRAARPPRREKKKEKKKKKPRPVDDALAALGRRAAFADAPGPARDEAQRAETLEAWDLPASTAAALAAAGFDAPTLAHDVESLLCCPGGGKTLAFLLPALAAVDPRDAAVRVLVVAPGRELAVQIADAAATFFPDLEVAAIFGGANAGRMRDRLKKRKPQVVVGTPGRLAEFALDGSRPLKLGRVAAIIVDEADATAAAPFVDDLEAVLGAAPRTARLVCASATAPALLDGDAASTFAPTVRDRARDALLVDARAAAGVVAGALRAGARHGRVTIRDDRSALEALRRVLRADDPPCEAAVVFVNDGDAAIAVANALRTRSPRAASTRAA
ncbi:DEAD DEAH box helicase [Aureococcus anophagefferens]|uniref:RNA helicase n=1 Tax=Aureococcus anophagefferens TaxID=44056 RepID=A0ABR1G2Z1_AURAN